MRDGGDGEESCLEVASQMGRTWKMDREMECVKQIYKLGFCASFLHEIGYRRKGDNPTNLV